MLVLSAADMLRALPMADAIAAVRKAFLELASGTAEVPLRPHIELIKHEGTAFFMPGFLGQADALAVKKSRGERVGGVPYGFRVVPGTAPAKLEADPGEQGVVLKARDLAEFGNSPIRIAKRFNDAGLRARNGKPFSPTQIARMLVAEVA